MSSRFNTLMHGDPNDAADILGAGDCSLAELHAVIANAMRRIAHIEQSPAITTDLPADAVYADPPGIDDLPTDWKPFVKMDKVCEVCHGEISFEGWISWSVEKQEFYVDDVCDKGHHCKTCDGLTHAIDVVYKRYAMQIEIGGGEHDENVERTFKFHTQAELTAFHDGMRTGAKIGEWEVSYTDEESECD